MQHRNLNLRRPCARSECVPSRARRVDQKIAYRRAHELCGHVVSVHHELQRYARSGRRIFTYRQQPGTVIPRRTVGATCTVTETRPAAPAGYAWTTPTSISFVVLPCSPGAPSQSPMIVTFPNTLVTAEVITEPAQGVPLLPLGGLAALALLLACFGASRVRKSR